MFELDRQGLWECWELEDGKIVLVDLIQEPQPNVTHYYEKKIKKRLGFATDRRSADNMYQQFTIGSVPIEVDK
jgi:hypothetical protein